MLVKLKYLKSVIQLLEDICKNEYLVQEVQNMHANNLMILSGRVLIT